LSATGSALRNVPDEFRHELAGVDDVDRDRPPVLHREGEERERLLAVERDDPRHSLISAGRTNGAKLLN
jgi:hypothetical protein